MARETYKNTHLIADYKKKKPRHKKDMKERVWPTHEWADGRFPFPPEQVGAPTTIHGSRHPTRTPGPTLSHTTQLLDNNSGSKSLLFAISTETI
ncbi:hypothetical protein JTE90_002188 [Oedothorax gibbosus]|uniref:Uncharacterized protein n=1 Tax=Oedothorax gibbosus TaxID=931172 RepID=A0AAV6VGE8_9ARAC|nr:hypothetical protein JTE90_002188 [Oedothorax gibbosus]